MMALQQAQITITGNVGSNPMQFGKDENHPACTFRLGCTRRYIDRNGNWQQLPTTWITVKAYRNLALNICNSFRKGEAVIVTGVLATEQWTTEDDGIVHTRTVIEASNAGHDLNFYVSNARRVSKEKPQPREQEESITKLSSNDSTQPVELSAPESAQPVEIQASQSQAPEEFEEAA